MALRLTLKRSRCQFETIKIVGKQRDGYQTPEKHQWAADMTPARFTECLLRIRWTPINLASALQCDLSWVEAMEVGNAEIPDGLAKWLETLAQCHEASPPPKTFRGQGHY